MTHAGRRRRRDDDYSRRRDGRRNALLPRLSIPPLLLPTIVFFFAASTMTMMAVVGVASASSSSSSSSLSSSLLPPSATRGEFAASPNDNDDDDDGGGGGGAKASASVVWEGGGRPWRRRDAVVGRGGGVASGVVRGVDVDPNPTTTTIYVDRRRWVKVASIASFAMSQSLNVACVAIVSSGLFGAYVASWMVRELRDRVLPAISSLTSSSAADVRSRPASFIIDGDYRWTALASLGHLLLLLPPAGPSYDDVASIAIMWAYSHHVDPILGGTIGMIRVVMGMASTVLGHPRLGNAIGRLMDVRYGKLDECDGSSVYVDPTRRERPSRSPVLTTTAGHGNNPDGIATRIASGMGSASLLVVLPRHFLGLYMLGSALAPSLSSLGGLGGRGGRLLVRPMIEGWARWWLFGEGGGTGGSSSSSSSSSDRGAFAASSIIAAGGEGGNGGIGGTIVPWRLSKRLVALYWMITLTKTAIAYILLM